ncbi:glycosyltransferase family 39 protein [Mesonia sp. K7]|uniref:ArnT family glycosyltransferase n=1 Tax=Mesonia sp. K7 TaxID=2218606 RepID=UPI001313EACA|nr:glycosyltransferase family 39 protein [Mesonia sp. K7]
MSQKSKLVKIIIIGLWLIIIAIPFFCFLEVLTLRIFDESRNANNAFEMYKSGLSIATTYEGKPELWNTKPPLLIWLQVISFHLFGVNAFAFRLPVASLGFLTCVGLFLFSFKHLKYFWHGIFTSLVLVTSLGFMKTHGATTGDFDVPLTFFTTLYCLSYFLYIKHKENKFLVLFFVGLLFSILTKSAAGLLFLPALFIFTIYKKFLFQLLQNKTLYLGIFFLIVFIGGYYIIRDNLQPNYIKEVIENEYTGRYNTPQEGNKGGFDYYFKLIKNHRFFNWFYLLFISFFLGFFNKNKKLWDLHLFSCILIISYFIVITLAKTKLEWYDIPMYPFFSIIIANFIYMLYDFISKQNIGFRKTPIGLTLVILFFTFPYIKVLNFLSEEEKAVYLEHHLMPKYLSENSSFLPDSVNVLFHSGYKPNLLFYSRALQEEGKSINFINYDEIDNYNSFIVNNKTYIDSIEKNYDFKKKKIYEFKNVPIYKFENLKKK